MSKQEIPKGTKSSVTWTSTGLLGMVTRGCWGAAHCRTPFPRDPARGEHHTSRATRDSVCAKASFQQHRQHRRKPVHAWQQLPFQHQHQNGTEFITPTPAPTVALPDPSVIPSGYSVWHSLRHSKKISTPGGNSVISKKGPQEPNTTDNTKV